MGLLNVKPMLENSDDEVREAVGAVVAPVRVEEVPLAERLLIGGLAKSLRASATICVRLASTSRRARFMSAT